MPAGAADSDRADVERVLAGEVDAFAGIVERWQRPLINLAYRFCGDAARAEDLAQEAFLRAFRHLHQWRGDGAFSTWLFALALNVYRSGIKVEREVSVEAAAAPLVAPTAFDDAAAEDRREVVRRAVLTLPPRYRDAVIMFYFRDQDLAAAARCLGVPDGTLKARLHRGRSLLRAKLARTLGPDPAAG